VSGSKASRDLRDLLAKLKALKASGMAKVSKALAVAAKGLILEGFEGGKDPYGKPWAPVARGGIPLNKDGHLRTSWFIAGATPSGFLISTNALYAQWHQSGLNTVYKSGPRKGRPCRIRQRMMIPKGGALPAAWDREFQAVAKAKLASLLKR